jgi:hypothetical protein
MDQYPLGSQGGRSSIRQVMFQLCSPLYQAILVALIATTPSNYHIITCKHHQKRVGFKQKQQMMPSAAAKA